MDKTFLIQFYNKPSLYEDYCLNLLESYFFFIQLYDYVVGHSLWQH